MGRETEKLSILRVTEHGKSEDDDVVAREFPFTIILDNQEGITPSIKYLANAS